MAVLPIRLFVTGGTFDKEYDMINGQLYFISFRLRRYVLRLRFSYGYGYDLVITALSLRLRHLRYGYDIIVTAMTSSLLLRPLEAYIYDFYDIN